MSVEVGVYKTIPVPAFLDKSIGYTIHTEPKKYTPSKPLKYQV